MKVENLKVAGFALITIFGFLVLFQLLLALGVNLPGAAWGSRHEVLPSELRIASFIASLILAFAICVVLEKIGIIHLFMKPGLVNGILWFFAAFFLLNTFMNALSPGNIEKYFMTPLALTTSILCTVMARNKFN